MLDQRNLPIYDLFFATKSLEGLKKMKTSMWGVDPVGGVHFSDRAARNQNLVLFEPTADLTPLRRSLLDQFAGRVATIEEVEEWILLETPYHPGHIRQKTLLPLEREGSIEHVPPPPRTKKGHYPPGCRLRFL
jgi:hypothetical protein